MREIGGYYELEHNTGSLLHDAALPLGSGRACLRYLIEQRGIRKLALPDFLCDVVTQVCRECGVETRVYPVGEDLRPLLPALGADEWLYVVNYYGQLTLEELSSIRERFPRLIVDNAQAYFDLPLPGVDTLYTCRKFLGVPDGGFLYTDAPERALPEDRSLDRMDFVLGRFEEGAGAFYVQASRNNDALPSEPRRMSRLTENLLRGIDLDRVRLRRRENFLRLHEALGKYNGLSVRPTEGAFAYPLLLENGPAVRQALIREKIFVPMLWPNVLREQPEGSTAYRLAENILPLPCDQRYGAEEMAFVAETVLRCLRTKNRKQEDSACLSM